LIFFLKASDRHKITQVNTEREQKTNETLKRIEAETEKELKRIEEVYKTEIETSRGFGYIAAIAICILLSLPLIGDILSKLGQNKVHSQK
jgi:hypothetical protein